MLVTDHQSPETDGSPEKTTAGGSTLGAATVGLMGASGLPLTAAPQLARLRGALRRHRDAGAPGALDAAFAAAAAVVAAAGATPQPGARPDLQRLRQLAQAIPDLGELLSCAADEAERAVAAGVSRVWHALELRGHPPAWTREEWDAARMVFACACVPAPAPAPERLRDSLRTLAAGRFAALIADALAAEERPWVRALADRYEPLRHRCARRTAWRSRGLAHLVRSDPSSREAVVRRLERWICAGADLDALAGELEAALVHARARPRFA
ncbi:MAG TPA: hypothetical protein VKV27_14395 [Solirubrobacteraceae bacterium]|nr:hypothetical protein [Solirubrobacteraceae bacterium]